MRSRSHATLAVAAAAAFVTAAGCAPEPAVEVTSGIFENREFSSHVTYYDLELPADVRALEWVQLRDWDSNQIYLRFSTDRAGLAQLLKAYRLTWSATPAPTGWACTWTSWSTAPALIDPTSSSTSFSSNVRICR